MATNQFNIYNPATGIQIGSVPDCNAVDAAHVIDLTSQSFPTWAAVPVEQRCNYLNKWADAIDEQLETLALLLTSEQGKPLAEARTEITGGAATIRWCAQNVTQYLESEIVASSKPNTKIVIDKKPIGPMVAITPWNFPASMVTRKIAPALAVGCSVILKPAEQTPLIAKALIDLAHQAGIPADVLILLTCSAQNVAAVGKVLCADIRIRKLSFTGSTEIGRLLMEQCAPTLKKLSLELGGNAPFIIFDDADLANAAKGLIASKFRNAGQTCVSANRVYVQEKIYDAFVAELKSQMAHLRVGSGVDANVTTGPLINQEAVEKVERHIADSVERGAQLIMGGKRHPLGGTYFEPTLLTGMTDDMQPACFETFGPVAALFVFEDEAEAVKRANSTEYGLSAYVYTKDYKRADKVAAKLDFGMVGINEVSLAMPQIPFGGVKQSGFGREGGKWGFGELLTLQYRLIGQ